MDEKCNLFVSLQAMDEVYASIHKKSPHVQMMMKGLGLTYEKAVPETLFDRWRFIGVPIENLPNPLPKYFHRSKYQSWEDWQKKISEISANTRDKS